MNTITMDSLFFQFILEWWIQMGDDLLRRCLVWKVCRCHLLNLARLCFMWWTQLPRCIAEDFSVMMERICFGNYILHLYCKHIEDRALKYLYSRLLYCRQMFSIPNTIVTIILLCVKYIYNLLIKFTSREWNEFRASGDQRCEGVTVSKTAERGNFEFLSSPTTKRAVKMFQELLEDPSPGATISSPTRLARAITSSSKDEAEKIMVQILTQCENVELMSPFFRFIHSILIVAPMAWKELIFCRNVLNSKAPMKASECSLPLCPISFR